MFIKDAVYGMHEIKEQALIELIHSAPLQRLKKIYQVGASKYLFPQKDVTRFEHSVGVMLLLRQFGAKLPEQIAGLLHDVPHTAFSHVADFVFENERHEFHELFHETIIRNSEIEQILEKYTISRKVIHPDSFPLLERPLPDLCADRIDYALRDLLSWNKDRESIVAKFKGLIVHKNEFMFRDQYSAEIFARDYLELDKSAWSHPREIAIYVLMAQAIQHAIERKMLTINELFTDDETVMNLLRTRGDAFVLKKLSYLTPRMRVEPATKHNHHLYLKTKLRFVDPKILIDDTPVRLSEISSKFKKALSKHIESNSMGWYVSVYKD